MTRRFNREQRILLYLLADGRCVMCGVELDTGWHADHVFPYERGGLTDISNGQALCPDCNQKKGCTSVRSNEQFWPSSA